MVMRSVDDLRNESAELMEWLSVRGHLPTQLCALLASTLVVLAREYLDYEAQQSLAKTVTAGLTLKDPPSKPL